MADDKDRPAEDPNITPPRKPAPTQTPQGAPTDAAHREAGDGTLDGSVPAGLTADQLHERAKHGPRDAGGTG